MSRMIPVLKPNPPPIEKWSKYLQMSYDQSQFSNGGPCSKLLESRLKDYLGLEHEPVLMCNATVALTVVLQALQLQGTPVLMPSFTFSATPLSLLNAGCAPILVDIDDDLQASVDSLKQQLWLVPDCKALVVVQALGFSCDYKKYEKFAAENNLKLIFDSAACLGASYEPEWDENGDRLYPEAPIKKVGTAGDCEVFSLHITKTFGIGEGALVTSKDKAFLDTCRQMINFGFNKKGETEMIGTNGKCSEFHAAVGLAVLDDIFLTMNEKMVNASLYNWYFKKKPVRYLYAWSGYQVYPLIFESKEVRDRVQAALHKKDILTRIYYTPTHKQPYFSFLAGYDLPKTDYYYERILCIPLFETISIEEQELIANIVLENL